MITAADLIRNRARLRMADRIAADRKAIDRINANAFMWLRPTTPTEQRAIDLLTRRIELCRTLRNNL